MALDGSLPVYPFDKLDSSVKIVTSFYTTPEHIQFFGSNVPLARVESSKEEIRCLPCSPYEQVYMSPCAENEKVFCYMYETLVLRVKLKIPFLDFEHDVLNAINLEPSQLQPNSWAFIWVFEILCELLDIKPLVEKFFHFFYKPKIPSKSIQWGFFQSYSS